MHWTPTGEEPMEYWMDGTSSYSCKSPSSDELTRHMFTNITTK